MIKSLRKRHLQVWTVLAILLPLGIISAWLYAPNPVPVKLLDKEQAALLPVTVQAKRSNCYIATLRSNAQKTFWQLEWENKTPLTTPSAVIYRLDRNSRGSKVSPLSSGGDPIAIGLEEAALIGRIEARGNYVFDIKKDSSINPTFSFVLYDFIHDKIIDSLNF